MLRVAEYDAVDPLQVLHLNLRCLDFALTPDLVALVRRMDPRPFPFFALYALDGDAMAGQVGVFRLPVVAVDGAEEVGGVWAVSTYPAFRGQGVASTLLDEAHARMRGAGLRYSTLGTGRHRVAHALYVKHGYRDLHSPARALLRRDALPRAAGLAAGPAESPASAWPTDCSTGWPVPSWAMAFSLSSSIRRFCLSSKGGGARVPLEIDLDIPVGGYRKIKVTMGPTISVSYKYGDGCCIRDGRLYVLRIGSIRKFQHRPLPADARPKQIALKRDRVGNWFAVVQIELPDPLPADKPLLCSVGIDMELSSFLALSTGELVENPSWYRKGEAKLARLQKMRARCQRGSKRYAELKRQIGAHHAKMAARRLDFQHKLSTLIVSQYDVIFVEKLNTKGLCRSHVAKSMYDAVWSQFLFFLRYKAERAGGARPEVDARGTPQLCPACGAEVRKELSERVHVSLACSCVAPRDVAAAQVVELRRAMGWTGPLRKVILSSGEVAGSRSLQ